MPITRTDLKAHIDAQFFGKQAVAKQSLGSLLVQKGIPLTVDPEDGRPQDASVSRIFYAIHTGLQKVVDALRLKYDVVDKQAFQDFLDNAESMLRVNVETAFTFPNGVDRHDVGNTIKEYVRQVMIQSWGQPEPVSPTSIYEVKRQSELDLSQAQLVQRRQESAAQAEQRLHSFIEQSKQRNRETSDLEKAMRNSMEHMPKKTHLKANIDAQFGIGNQGVAKEGLRTILVREGIPFTVDPEERKPQNASVTRIFNAIQTGLQKVVDELQLKYDVVDEQAFQDFLDNADSMLRLDVETGFTFPNGVDRHDVGNTIKEYVRQVMIQSWDQEIARRLSSPSSITKPSTVPPAPSSTRKPPPPSPKR